MHLKSTRSSISDFALLRNSIPTAPPNHRSVNIKHIWYTNQQRTDTPKDSKCPMNTHILVKRDPNNRHTTRSAITRDPHEPQRRYSVDTVRVDNIHV